MVVWYVTGRLESMLDADRRAAIEHYLRVHQQTDGGWAARVELVPSCHSSALPQLTTRASRGAGSGQAPPGLLAA